jgi:histidyl-tRNA synthetase
MEKERIIVKKTSDGFSATTESNHKAMIQDARKVWKFRESEGFKEFSDVKEYIKKWFHIEDVVLEE